MDEALRAQARFVAKYTKSIAVNGYTDDDTDYLPGSLAILAALMSDAYNAVGLAGDTMMRDTSTPVSAEVAEETHRVIAEYGAYAGDYGPPSVFAFLGLGKEE